MGLTHSEEQQLHWFHELVGMNIYNHRGDIWFGVLSDLMIDPNLLEVAAIVTTGGKALKRNMKMIPSIEMKAKGQDAILVRQAELFQSLDELPEYEKWLSVVHHLVGSDVVTTSGESLGELADIIVSERGSLSGYGLKPTIQVSSKDYRGKTDYIPSIATHSLGTKLLIINARNLKWITDWNRALAQ